MKFSPTSKWQKGIALIGAENTGKTTLIRELQQKIDNVSIITEYVRECLRELGLSRPPTFGSDTKLIQEFQHLVYTKRTFLETAAQGPFLADRTPIDSFLYSLSALSRDPGSQEWLDAVLKSAIDHLAKHYHYIFLLPHGALPMVDDGVRCTLRFNALMMHYLFVGFLQENLIPYHVVHSVPIPGRVAEILAVLERLGYIKVNSK